MQKFKIYYRNPKQWLVHEITLSAETKDAALEKFYNFSGSAGKQWEIMSIWTWNPETKLYEQI